MKKVGIYVRVSTGPQAKEGYSIPEQKERLTAYCKARDWNIVKVYVDAGYTGSNIERPGMEALIKDVEEGNIDTVLVYKLDRLSRSQKDTLYLIEDLFLPNGVNFVSMQESFDTSTPFGRAVLSILSVFSQLERELIAERTFMGRKGRAKDGKWHGCASHPIGYDYKEGELVINEKEAEQVRMVYEYYSRGMTITEICNRMEGYKTKHGDWHHPGTVANVLDNPLYSGTVHFDDVLTPNSHKAVVPKELFDTVSSMRSGEYKKAKKDSKYMLSGLVYCKNCGARYFVKKNPNKNLFYCCHSRAKVNKLMIKDPSCKNKNWKKEELEAVVYKEVKMLADNPHLLYKLKKIPPAATGGKSDTVQEEIDKISGEISHLMDLYQTNDKTIQVEDIAQRIDELYQKKVFLMSQTNSMNGAISNRYAKLFNVESARMIISDLPAAMREGNMDIVRYSLLRLLDGIEIDGENVHFLWSFVD